MNLIPAYRDGVPLFTRGEVFISGDAVIEVLYDKSGTKKTFFAELTGVPACGHGDSVEEAIDAALEKRGEVETLSDEKKEEYRAENYRFTVRLFRKLTRACRAGCEEWLSQRGLKSDVTMTLAEFRAAGGGAWADKLEEVLK